MVNAAVAEGLSADAAQQRRIRPTFGYYRQANGWITVSPVTRLERVKYMERGWQHLAQYGAFDMSPYVANHPLEALFMFGGAKELPVDQIVQMGLHLNPPQVPTCRQHMTQFHRGHTAACWQGAAPVQFPQLADVDPSRLQPYPCEFCPRVLPTPQARNQHQQVAHKDEIASLRSGRSLAVALAEKPQAVVAVPAPPAASVTDNALLERIDALEKRLREKDEASARMARARARRKSGVTEPPLAP